MLFFILLSITLIVIFSVESIRKQLVSRFIMKAMKILNVVPKISDTEKEALEAGAVWVEKEFFSGDPDIEKINSLEFKKLSQEEKEFLEGPVNNLCKLMDDWQIWQDRDLSPEAWDYIKKEKFLGMIIPKEYGGLGFSALAHSEVVMKLASRSLPGCITVMVPNSLGPAELLIHYGTEDQKKKLLPKLATGEEIPCFALTEPTAGSDAGSLTSSGELFKDAEGNLKIKLNWNKRWITLAAVSTTIGLAFRLKDPDNILGKGEDLGITCALVPAETPGVVLGKRHDPLGVPFYNCPTKGEDVIVDAEEAIIGGLEKAGQGWTMLMESLAAGRGISLPAQTTGGAKLTSRVITAHANIRKQFGVEIGKFEGVEEALAEIIGYNYIMNKARIFTLGGIDNGEKPPVVTAMLKYNFTEFFRKVINHGMDIMGGAAITRGPKNTLAHGYISTPIAITVEGANILTRTLIVFGQGALRAHPYAYKEVKALEENNLDDFDKAFFGHIVHILKNKTRAVLYTLTRGSIIKTHGSKDLRKYYKKIKWASAIFAFFADVAMGSLGGKLKMKEKLTGNFADVLSWLYLNSAVLHQYENSSDENSDVLEYSLEMGFYKIQQSLEEITANLKIPGLSWTIRIFNFLLRMNPIGQKPSHDLSQRVAKSALQDMNFRDQLTKGIYLPKEISEQVGFLDHVLEKINDSKDIEKKLKKAIRKKKLPKKPTLLIIQEALDKKIIKQEEYDQIKESEELRRQAIEVDSFDLDEYKNNR